MKRLIRVIDTETQGKDDDAKVIEFAQCDLVDDGSGWEVGEPKSWLHYVDHIPPEARAVHHILQADVDDKAPFDPEVFWNLAVADGVAIVAAHNIEFDAKRLGAPRRPLLCTYKAALRVWPDAPEHKNGTLRYWLEDQGLITLDDSLTQPAHRAGPDTYVTAHILKALLQHATAQQMEAWTRSPALLPRCPIGEHRGKLWADVDEGFLRWMINKPVEPDLVWNAELELARRTAA